MSITIVQLTKENSKLLRNLDESVFDQEIDDDRLAAFLDDSNHILLVALNENIVIGQISAVIHRHPDKPTELYVDDLAVADSHLRQGIATRLVKELSTIGGERGCEEIWVATEPGNNSANGLYRSVALAENSALIFDRKLTPKDWMA